MISHPSIANLYSVELYKKTIVDICKTFEIFLKFLITPQSRAAITDDHFANRLVQSIGSKESLEPLNKIETTTHI